MKNEADLCSALFHHAYEVFNPIDMEPPYLGWRLSLRCVRCGTERHDTKAYGTHQLLSRRYIWPDGYLYEKGQRPTREEFQEELFTRLRAQLKEHNALGPKDGAKITNIKSVRKSSRARSRNTRKSAG